MGRKVGISTNAVLSFIAPDDEAIGNTTTEAYNKYVETANTEFLELKGRPVRYYVRALNSRAWQRMLDAFKIIGDATDAEQVLSPDKVDDMDINLRMLFADIVRECLVGCEEHPDVNSINDDGTFNISTFSWKPGDREPEGLFASILADNTLMTSIINFLIRVSTLKETEKKA